MTMKRTLIYTLFILTLIACGNVVETPEYTIGGKVADSKCTLYITGLDSRYEKLDTIAGNENGEFSFSLSTDTITPLLLILPNGKSVTLYAENGWTASLNPDSTMDCGYRVEGAGTMQTLHDSITRVLDRCETYEKRVAAIDSFIKYNPTNEICVELIRRYMVEIPTPDNQQIRQRIPRLSGILQDHEYFSGIKNSIDQNNSNTINKSFPTFTYTTADDREVKLAGYSRKYLLVTFWASWNGASRKELNGLRALNDSIGSERFAILNISLDHDKNSWKEFIESDSIIGDNVCESNSFSSNIVQKINIGALPYSVLVSPYQRIVKYDIDIEKDYEYIDSLVTKFDKDEDRRTDRNNR